MKWAGGKRQLLTDINRIIPLERLQGHTFYEPFVGGGSVFLAYEHTSVVINDYNQELMNVYRVIRDEPGKLIEALKIHKANHSHDYYYEIRSWDRQENYRERTDIEKAARIVYLNRTCFNGLYRVNSKGHFNVPIGKYSHPDIVLEDKITLISNYLNSASIMLLCGDFSEAVSTAKAGDIIYFDPPYDYETNGFTSYTPGSFSRNDLLRLRTLCDDLVDRGCTVLLSNNETAFVREIFADSKYSCENVLAKRMINSNGKKRNEVQEVLIYG